MLTGVALDSARARWTTKWSPGSVVRDQVKDLRGIVRIWTRLTHRPSDDPSLAATFEGSG